MANATIIGEKEYFYLRSFEQHIVRDIFYYAASLDKHKLNLSDVKHLDIYYKNFGDTDKDMGMYVMIKNQVAAGIWVRDLGDSGFGYVKDNVPELVFGVKPKFRDQGLGSELMEHFLDYVKDRYKAISLVVESDNKAIKLFEKFGFNKVADEQSENIIKMLKEF